MLYEANRRVRIIIGLSVSSGSVDSVVGRKKGKGKVGSSWLAR